VVRGFLPSPEIVTNPEMLYIAIGIIGATVMPHNLYLHSSIVQTRNFERNEHGLREAIKFATADSTIALMLALFINASILIVAAAVFHANGKTDVAEIEDAYALLSPLLGVGAASILFAIALLASGLNSTVTATLAGQIVMEGFLRIRIPQWARRLVTRGIAIVPVIIVTALYGERGTSELLVFSQVVLSMQLPFAVIPLVLFVSDRKKMGSFAISRPAAILAWTVAAIILVLNFKLLFDAATGAN
jgi:manganese transport protein